MKRYIAWTVVAACVVAGCGQKENSGGGDGVSVDALPLQSGYYVVEEPEYGCDKASNATLMLIGRKYYGWSQLSCDVSRVEKTGQIAYSVMSVCRNIEGAPDGDPSPVRFEVDDDTHYRIAFGDEMSLTYRYCEQSSLPEPWSNNDISDLVK